MFTLSRPFVYDPWDPSFKIARKRFTICKKRPKEARLRPNCVMCQPVGVSASRLGSGRNQQEIDHASSFGDACLIEHKLSFPPRHQSVCFSCLANSMGDFSSPPEAAFVRQLVPGEARRVWRIQARGAQPEDQKTIARGSWTRLHWTPWRCLGWALDESNWSLWVEDWFGFPFLFFSGSVSSTRIGRAQRDVPALCKNPCLS